MGTLLVLAVVVWGVFMGLVLFSLLSIAKRSDQLYGCMHRGEEINTPATPFYRPASETLSPTSSSEAQPQSDLSGSVATS
jgi:hypothetical protein